MLSGYRGVIALIVFLVSFFIGISVSSAEEVPFSSYKDIDEFLEELSYTQAAGIRGSERFHLCFCKTSLPHGGIRTQKR